MVCFWFFFFVSNEPMRSVPECIALVEPDKNFKLKVMYQGQVVQETALLTPYKVQVLI